MPENFITAKKRSRFNLGVFLAPLVGFVLMILAELAYILFAWNFFGYLPTISPENLLLDLLGFAPIIVIFVLWAKLVEKSPWAGIGFRKKGAIASFFKGYAIGAGLLTLCVLIVWLLGGLEFKGFNLSTQVLLSFIPIFGAWIIQGTAEEVVCRGWLFSSLSARHNTWVGLAISSLFFTALHLGNNGISLIPLLDLLLFGILAALYMLKTDDIWGVSGIHAAWNCFQGNIFSIAVSGSNAGPAFIQVSSKGPDWLSGGSFGIEGSLISVLVQTLFIVWLIWDRQKNSAQSKTKP